MADELHRRVIRALASGKMHVAYVPLGQFTVAKWIGPPFIGVELPVVALCATTLRGRNGAAVCMEPGSRVTCRTCARLARLDRADDDNHLHPNGLDGPTAWDLVQVAAAAPATDETGDDRG